VEQKCININLDKAWGNWVQIGSQKIKSILFKYMLDAWLTGEIADRSVAKMSTVLKLYFFYIQKPTYFTQCMVTRQERNKIIQSINAKHMF
jgi:hypothetical protein